MKWFSIALILASLACGSAPGDPPPCDETEPAEWLDTPLEMCEPSDYTPNTVVCYYEGDRCWYTTWCGPSTLNEWQVKDSSCLPTDWDGPEFYEW